MSSQSTSRAAFEADHAESVLEEWLEANPDAILEDGRLLIIGRQVPTDLGGSIDLLGVDREGKVVVIELKRGRTPRDVIAQALEYVAFAARLDADALEDIHRAYSQDPLEMDLAFSHREHFSQSEAVAFNKDQRIVIVGQSVPREIRQTAMFLGSKGILVTCVEFTFFRDADGGRLLSQEIVVGREDAKPSRTVGSKVSKTEFLESCDEHGRAVFARILDLADRKGMSVRWGIKGFSMGVEVSGTRVVISYVYPPGTFWSALYDRAGIQKKTAAPAEAVAQLQQAAEHTGLFEPAGRGQSLKCVIDRPFTEDETNALVAWCESVEQAIQKYGG